MTKLHYIRNKDCNMKEGLKLNKGKLIAQGKTSEVFEYGQDKILKLFRKDLPEKNIENEYEVSFNLSKKMKLVPKVYDLVEVDDRKGIIYEKVNGTTMMEVISSKPWKVKKEAQRLAELHEAIQKPVDFELPDYKTTLKENISKTELLEEDIKKRLYDYIDELKDDDLLCHGDFHPDNVLITEEGEVIIDWMTASKGSRIADIARTSVMLKFGASPVKRSAEKKIIKFVRNRFYSGYIKHYMKITGINKEQIEEWELPIAAARLNEWLPKSEKVDLLKFIDMKMK
ncbi:aminoglycoside phosphotransferase family protein [Clostridium acetobutylicum]|uniref:Possible aminoglycoside phosphotransferase (Protein kinase related), diverged n=1 Tax=Clostridium acetobutylicum (strain ATCC 824 / DSM 792 / JCM 1419 / IAM 19013 / LMG 5710 / NBRC 13948 / NRRL B-527 / VKM B-1787 / 2291 / W) TaxID=272562 RepID=Q97G02_CLOAB|nr:Possible aminoglycoside phosphotransferase (protein kinase related), diverged [Clostridium acetobutylicum ATCC 824]AEI32439.1 aminoglycoside phosphotransferase [Clostridium acetobutylicum DSM 1731]AWV79061.1 aminoglycoside phosphotransferase family protein [Clostridium acetobutylicum]PSM07021.1 aminoglycoside phosphotransferase family protein [Clostridium sp. NJ4]MBC2394978.1 aminoglycoside phosphotransferase family protein [Clostridium acetobutylicum]